MPWVVGVRADVVDGGIIPADKSIATANARERRQIPRFMMDTFGWQSRLAIKPQDAPVPNRPTSRAIQTTPVLSPRQ
jgi:hypothetical protein